MAGGNNPYVTIGTPNFPTTPPDWPRTVFTRRQYSPLAMFSHTKKNPTSKDYFLGGEGKHDDTIFFYTMKSQVENAGAMPSFLTKENYDKSYSKMNTGFLTPQRSIMPKILVPSQKIIDNGIWDSLYEGVINWETDKDYAGATPEDSQRMIILKSGGETNFTRTATLKQENIEVSDDVGDVDSDKMVGGGAFQIVVCFFDIDITSKYLIEKYDTEVEKGEQDSTSLDDKRQCYVKLDIGDLSVIIEADGKCAGSWNSGEKNSCSINLISGSGEECIPQAEIASKDGKVYILSVYPCWNGVVIQSGVQAAPNLTSSSAAFIPKWRGASIFDFADKQRVGDQEIAFSPHDPKPIIVRTKKDDIDVIPNLGEANSQLFFSAVNCECKIAYAPLYFHTRTVFDHVIRGSLTTSSFKYTYTSYPIWTDNGTSCSFPNNNGIEFVDTGAYGGVELTNLFKAENDFYFLNSDIYSRVAGEIFGCIVGMEEERLSPEDNSHGNYNNGISNWEQYITGVTISNSMDSSGGSITFDKYGALKGDSEVLGNLQDVEINQSVGQIEVKVGGGYNTKGLGSGAKSIFKGYTWTASDNRSSSGADVTITLVGIEKRLAEYHLINPPIFDGYQFGRVVDYICKSAGVGYDLSNADSDTQLMMSTDINVVLYNWQTGMDAKSALDQVCQDTAHRYIPRNGVLFFYCLKSDGSPDYSGENWSGDFSGENIISFDSMPDFDGLRNQVVLIAMRKNNKGRGKSFPDDFPVFPITALIKNDTDPDIPWPKAICYTLPGYLEEKELFEIGDNIAKSSRRYELLGTVTVPGAPINVFDTFLGDLVVIDVSHNIDLVGKTWTTSLGFMRKSQ